MKKKIQIYTIYINVNNRRKRKKGGGGDTKYSNKKPYKSKYNTLKLTAS